MTSRGARVGLRFGSAMAAASLVSCAPAAPTPAPGALVVVLDTNLAPGRDFDRLDLEVDEAPGAGRRWTYAFDATSGTVRLDEDARLPLTVTVQNTRSSPAVRHVHVRAWSVGRAIYARDVNVVVPATEVRALRVTVDELCVGEAVSLEGTSVTRVPWVSLVRGSPVSCRGGGLTCVGGSCVDAHVDGSALEAYDPRAVFGGAPGPSETGSCVDVRGCFTGGDDGSPLPPVAVIPRSSSAGCGVQVLSGTLTADAFTVAHETEGRRGLCGPGGCLAWLGRTEQPRVEGGWQVRGDRILVPEALCAGSRTVYLARARSARCPGKSRATPSCAPWSSVGPREPNAATNAAPLRVDGARDDGAVCGRVTRAESACAALGLRCGAISFADPLCASSAVDARTLACGAPCEGATVAMVRFEGGVFPMGSEIGEVDEAQSGFTREELERERPLHLARVAPFWLDRDEVDTATYDACVRAGACTAAVAYDAATKPRCNAGAPGRERHPINCITRAQGASLCSWRGLRMPTEQEWEFAARGGAQRRRFPWGDEAPSRAADRACAGKGEEGVSCVVGSSTEDVTPEGVRDLAGNVSEWVSSGFSRSYAEAAGALPMRRGGSFATASVPLLRGAVRSLGSEGDEVGIRCARGE